MKKLMLSILLCFVFLLNTKAQTIDTIAAPKEIITPQTVTHPVDVVVDEDQIFTNCEIPPSFPGGNKAWEEYLNQHLSTINPLNCSSGDYHIFIRFIVDKKGNASDFNAETLPGCSLEKEAIKLLKGIAHWEPAKQNGAIVKAYVRWEVPLVIH